VRLAGGAAREVLAEADYMGFARRYGIAFTRSQEANRMLDELRTALRAVIG